MNKPEVIVEPGRQDVVITRQFDAPPDVVYKAMMDPELIPNWWGPRRYKTVVDRMEPRAGGEWRFGNIADDGGEHWFRGVYHQVSPQGVIQTFEYEPVAGHVSLDTMTLEDLGNGRTLMRVVSVFQSIEDRDGMVQSGMESGMTETYERLDEILAGLLARA